MMTFLILLLVMAVLAVTMTVIDVLRDGKGSVPAPRSHWHEGPQWPGELRHGR